MIGRIILMVLWLVGACTGLVLIVQGVTGWSGGTKSHVLLGVGFTIIYARWFLRELRDIRAKGKPEPIVLERPDASFRGLDFEGGAFADPDAPGWQVVPYSSAREWPCVISDADAVQFRGAPGVISFAEARRMAAALVATADYAEAAQKERDS